MSKPFVAVIHPSDHTAGVALITAAMWAMRPAARGAVAAWDDHRPLYHKFNPAMAAMLRAAGDSLPFPSSHVYLWAAAEPRPGLVLPHHPYLAPPPGPAIKRIVETFADGIIASGAVGLLVSEGRLWDSATLLSFCPGILHINPTSMRMGALCAWDVFVSAGFPTLAFSEEVGPLSAHEVLDRCGQLAARIAEDVSRGLPPDPLS